MAQIVHSNVSVMLTGNGRSSQLIFPPNSMLVDSDGKIVAFIHPLDKKKYIYAGGETVKRDRIPDKLKGILSVATPGSSAVLGTQAGGIPGGIFGFVAGLTIQTIINNIPPEEIYRHDPGYYWNGIKVFDGPFYLSPM